MSINFEKMTSEDQPCAGGNYSKAESGSCVAKHWYRHSQKKLLDGEANLNKERTGSRVRHDCTNHLVRGIGPTDLDN